MPSSANALGSLGNNLNIRLKQKRRRQKGLSSKPNFAAEAPEKIALAEDFRGRGKRRSVTAHTVSQCGHLDFVNNATYTAECINDTEFFKFLLINYHRGGCITGLGYKSLLQL